MKKSVLGILTLALVFSVTACGAKETSPKSSPAPANSPNSNVQLANPFTTHDTLEQAEQAAGFSLDLPAEIPDWVQETIYRNMGTEMLEVIFAGSDNELRIRKGPLSDTDISGTTNAYTLMENADIDGKSVSFYGTEESLFLAVWQQGDYQYSAHINSGIDRSTPDLLTQMAHDIH